MNIYIETWKNTIDVILTAYKIFYDKSKEIDIEKKLHDELLQLASKQLKLLDEGKPNKNKSLYEQCNEDQKEFIDYLERVIVYGNLEGEKKCQF